MEPTLRDAFVVLGMHRSGTSALAGTLAKLGASPPLTMGAAAADNPRGFWEPRPIAELDDEILAAAGSRWDDWRGLDPAWFDTPDVAPLHRRARDLLIAEYGAAERFVLKDPRMCRLVRFWSRVLAEADVVPRYVLPVRMPLEVARSLAKRNGFTIGHGVRLWLRHVLDAEQATRGAPRCVVAWDDILRDWRTEIARMSSELGVAMRRGDAQADAEVDAFLDAGLRHQHVVRDETADGPDMHGLALTAYTAMIGLARRPGDPAPIGVLDDVRERFDSACRLFGEVFADREALERRLVAAEAHGAAQADALVREREAAREREGRLLAAIEAERAVAASLREEATSLRATIAEQSEWSWPIRSAARAVGRAVGFDVPARRGRDRD